MSKCPIVPPTKLIREHVNDEPHNQRKFGLVDVDSFKWSLLPLQLTKFSFVASDMNTQLFYLMEDFHGGSDGRVWLYATQSGKIGVMKLSARSDFTRETEAWINVWKVPFVRVMRILNFNSLLMPYAFHSGFVQGNIKFRPFGFWNRDEFTYADYNNSEVDAEFDLDCIRYYSENFGRPRRKLCRKWLKLDMCTETCVGDM
mmetsp:Transcript_7191/g.10689  ORF Transcript_7191/g.10689 Transcript_7191/m.10689 type:complete len:201 (-) Transcript_7191:218-820(-)